MKNGKLFNLCYALLILFCCWGERVQAMVVLHDQLHYFYTKLSEPSKMFSEMGNFVLIPEAILQICRTAK